MTVLNRSSVWLTLGLCVLFTFPGELLRAQTKSSKVSKDPAKAPAQAPGTGKDNGTTPTKPPNASIQSKIAADLSHSRDLGDSVPCEFSRADLLNLRPRPEVYTLTDADEDALRAGVIAEALDGENSSTFAKTEQRDAFVKHIAEAAFVGLTPSQATGKVLSLLSQDTASDEQVAAMKKASTRPNADFAQYLQESYQIDKKDTLAKLGPEEQPPQQKLTVAIGVAQNKLAKGTAVQSGLLGAAGGKNQDFAKYVSETLKLDVGQDLGTAEKSAESKLDAASRAAATSGTAGAQEALSGAKELVSAESLSATASEATKALGQGPGKNQVAQAAQQTTAALARPRDIACSMSILSYEATRYAFGQRMADEFIPVQIVVRNLNPNKEFLVQDAQMAVDEDINGRFGKYASGIDKLTARTFMLSSRDYSHRNLVVHLAQGLGTVLSSASLVYGTAVKDAANVYSAGFLNALTGVWTDHGTEQLNLLNDEGFSSYRTERTVVPKSGTAEFVIFIRSDQFQQGWWVQSCAENIVIKNPNQMSRLTERQSARCVGQMNLASPDSKCLANSEISVDLEAARRVCLHYYKNSANRSHEQCKETGGDCEPNLVDIGKDLDVEGDFAYFKPTSVIYKKWSPTAVALFRELSLAVIAGTHIEEETATASNLTKVECPVDDKGDIDFDKAEDGKITCTLSGTNLDQIQTLKLRNSADATDTKTATGAVTTTSSAGANTSKVAFQEDVLGGLTAKAYKVYTVTKDGVEGGGDVLLHLPSGTPYLPASGKPDPNTLNLADLLGKDGKAVSVTLKGYHLDNLQAVRFAKSVSDKTTANVTPFDVSVDPGATSAQAQVTVMPDDVKKARVTGDFTTQKLELSLALISKDAPNTPSISKQVIYGTGNLSAAAPAATTPKPTTPINGKKPGAGNGQKPASGSH